jgi:hypothetical protein
MTVRYFLWINTVDGSSQYIERKLKKDKGDKPANPTP